MESKKVTDKHIIKGNVLIAEFLGYTESVFNVHLHSRRGGFGSGYKGKFIKKTQYDYLLECMNNNDNLSIDKFYGDKIENYKYDNTHLFLSAYNNHITPLDFLHRAEYLQYHKSWDALIPAITVLRENKHVCVIKTKETVPDIDATWESIVDTIIYINEKRDL